MASTRRASSTRGAGGLGRLFDRRLAAQLLQQLPRHVAHPRHRLDHVHRNANRAALIGHGPGDRLANPPRGVGAELEAAAILELVDRPHQAGVAFLNQVQEAQARGCDTSWRSTRPAASCLPTGRAWPVDIASKRLQVRDAIAQAGGRFLRGRRMLRYSTIQGSRCSAAAPWPCVVGVDLDALQRRRRGG